MKKKRKKVHEEYHRKTKSQFRVIDDNNFTYREIILALKNYLKEGMKILDIGCGAGTIDFYLASKGYDLTGIDISGKAIKACKATQKNLRLNNIKFNRVAFPEEKIDGKFDLIILSEVLEHIENDGLAIRKIKDLLKKNGILFLTTPSVNAPLFKIGAAKKFDKEVGHLRRYNAENLIKILEDMRFEVLEVKMTEGILRNFLFINPIAGKFIKFIKFVISDLVTLLDKLTIPVLGESNFIVVAKKN